MTEQNRDLANQVVLIAGASSGMGRATAMAAAAAGATLVVAARNGAALAEVVISLEATGVTVLAVPTDMTDPDAVARLVRTASQEFGRIDTAVNTVGTNIPRRALDELNPDSWADLIGTNLTSAFHLTQGHRPALPGAGWRLVDPRLLLGGEEA